MVNLKSSINTAMKWFDEGKYRIQGKHAVEEQELSEFP